MDHTKLLVRVFFRAPGIIIFTGLFISVKSWYWSLFHVIARQIWQYVYKH